METLEQMLQQLVMMQQQGQQMRQQMIQLMQQQKQHHHHHQAQRSCQVASGRLTDLRGLGGTPVFTGEESESGWPK